VGGVLGDAGLGGGGRVGLFGFSLWGFFFFFGGGGWGQGALGVRGGLGGCVEGGLGGFLLGLWGGGGLVFPGGQTITPIDLSVCPFAVNPD